MKLTRRSWIAFCFIFVTMSFGLNFSARAADNGVQNDVVYGEAAGEQLKLDIYGADPAVKKPALVMLHGGGWVAGSRKDMASFAPEFAKQGFVCFSVEYRLVKNGKNGYPAQIDDSQRAVRWIRAHAADYGVNPDKIGALGMSAGGHLVALLGTMDTRDNSDTELAKYSSRVQCVVDLYGPTDFTVAPDPNQAVNQQGVDLVEGFLGKLPENAEKYKEASPVKHVDKTSAPFLIFHGAKDSLVPLSQSQILDKALKDAGVESKLVVFPNAGHAYDDPESLFTTFTMSIEFLNRHLKG